MIQEIAVTWFQSNISNLKPACPKCYKQEITVEPVVGKGVNLFCSNGCVWGGVWRGDETTDATVRVYVVSKGCPRCHTEMFRNSNEDEFQCVYCP